jgi:hypothetical protein
MSNPFGDAGDDDDNPFARNDPTPVPSQPASPPPVQSSSPAPAFNPFNDDPPAASRPPPPPETSYTPPSTTRSSEGGYRDVTGGFHSFREMDRREEELRRREAELAGLEEQVRTGTYQRQREKNFPPVLHWWSWHPVRDLPENAQSLLRRLRVLFMSLFLVYLLNAVGCLAVLFAPAKKDENGNATDKKFSGSAAVRLVLSVLFAFVFEPLSFELSFFPIYKAISHGRAIPFFCGLAVYVIWGLILIFNIIGVPQTGSVGFIMMIDAFGINTGVGVIALLFCLLAIAAAVAMAFGLIALVRYYRANGLVAKAKAEGAKIAVDYAKEHPEQALEVAKQVA